MKLISFEFQGRPAWGTLGPDGVCDLTRATGLENTPTLEDALARFSIEDLVDRSASRRGTISPDDIDFLPVVPRPSKILCVGLNYRAHILETGRETPEHPMLFTRFAVSQVGHRAALVRPRESIRFDFEGELAVVIGRSAHHVFRDRALEYVAGYACFNDGSIRDWQRHSTHFTAGKNFVASGSFGPWLVTRDEIADPARLHLRTRLNGVEVQNAPVSDLLFDIPTLIEYISTFTRLDPGDVVVTGTPGGVGAAREPPLWLSPGDVVEVDIDGIGVLSNSVVDAATT